MLRLRTTPHLQLLDPPCHLTLTLLALILALKCIFLPFPLGLGLGLWSDEAVGACKVGWWCAEGFSETFTGPVDGSWHCQLSVKVKLASGSKNVNSDVESVLNWPCNVVIFQQGLNLLLGPQSPSAWAQGNTELLSSFKSLTHNKLHKWQNTFLRLSFLFPPLSSPCPTLPTLRKRGQRGTLMCWPIRNFYWPLYLFCCPCLAPT